MVGRRLPEVKNKSISIKRETRNGKYYVVLRENGKAVESILWTATMSKKRPEAINTRAGKTRYKENNSIYDTRRRTTEDTWKTVFESRYTPVQNNQKAKHTPKINRIKNQPYKYYVNGALFTQNNTRSIQITASSKNHKPSYPVNKARDEAWTSFYERVDFIAHNSIKGNYDESEGRRIVEQGRVRIIEEGIMHYRPK